MEIHKVFAFFAAQPLVGIKQQNDTVAAACGFVDHGDVSFVNGVETAADNVIFHEKTHDTVDFHFHHICFDVFVNGFLAFLTVAGTAIFSVRV